MVTPESIKLTIEAGLACEHVSVDGDGQHFQALIVSKAFETLSGPPNADQKAARAKLRDLIAATRDYPGVTGRISLDEHRNAVKTAVFLGIEEVVQDDTDRSPLLMLTPAYVTAAKGLELYAWQGLVLRNGGEDVDRQPVPGGEILLVPAPGTRSVHA